MPALLALAGFAKSTFSGIVQWLSRRSLAEIICITLSLALILDHIWGNHWKNVATQRQAQLSACQKGRAADRAGYIEAQREAAQANKVQVQKVEQHYQRNSDNERQAYLDDLAKLRAGRVRAPTPAAPGSAGPTSPSTPDAGTPRIDDAGVCVPATSDVCEAGAEIELRLMRLQNLFEQQTQVDPNK
jgi:hypothetical protein